MATLFDYLEWVGDGASPSTMTFSTSIGQSNEIYLLKNITTFQQLQICIRELIGDSIAIPQQPGLIRTLPLRHPIMPWYCIGCNSFQGYGQPYIPKVNPFQPFIPQVAKWCLYQNWRLQLNFQPLPYPVLSNQVLGNWEDGEWYRDNGTLQKYTYAKEWERMCIYTPQQSDDNVTAQHGYLAFNALNLPENARTFLAQPRLYLNNEKMSITWLNVPFSYITSNYSYLKRFRGRVNQSSWSTKNFGSFGPGEVLYLGYSTKIYNQPFDNNTYAYPGFNIPDFKRNCDITLNFMTTNRTLEEVPLNEPQNPNWIAGGFNLQPFIGDGTEPNSRTFLYASTTPHSGAFSRPLFDSFPIQILFSNPDATDHI